MGLHVLQHRLQRRMPRAAELEPFDSNLPVQWDSSAEVGGLSRYFNSPSAGLGRAPEGHLVGDDHKLTADNMARMASFVACLPSDCASGRPVAAMDNRAGVRTGRGQANGAASGSEQRYTHRPIVPADD